MNNKVYIIHRSDVIRKGLSAILEDNFKCEIYLFSNFEDAKEKLGSLNGGAIILADKDIINNNKYSGFLQSNAEIKIFRIVNCDKAAEGDNDSYSFSLYSSADDIYSIMKKALVSGDVAENKEKGLTEREVDVLKNIALGYSNKEIAERLFISTHTVITHRKNITEKLGIKSVSGLTVYAIINNYIDTSNLNVADLI